MDDTRAVKAVPSVGLTLKNAEKAMEILDNV